MQAPYFLMTGLFLLLTAPVTLDSSLASLGYLTRRYGLSIDSLLSVDMLVADGSFVTANESEHLDLYLGRARRWGQFRGGYFLPVPGPAV